MSQVRTLMFLPCLRAVALSSKATLVSSTFVTVWIWVSLAVVGEEPWRRGQQKRLRKEGNSRHPEAQ